MGKPVDPATRLSELLAQSLEELTRPFDPSRPGQHPSQPVARDDAPGFVPQHEPPAEPQPELSREHVRVDADKALAELEAELFAAAQQVDRDTTIPHEETDPPAAHEDGHGDAPVEAEMAALLAAHPPEKDASPVDEVKPEIAPLVPAETKAAEVEAEPAPDAAASAVIARVRRLMLISMAVTVIAVGAVFGFVGYRIFKGEGMVEKKADKLPESSSIPTDVTLSLPRGTKVIQSAVTNDRLIMTLEIDGRIEVRTFDVKTLTPTGRLDFSATP